MENIIAAVCASRLAGASLKNIVKTVFSFKGLEHRLEFVNEIKGRKFYNDSFSTNPQPTLAAADSFSESLTMIIGGYDKGLNYEEMVIRLSSKKNFKNVLLIGNLTLKLFNLFQKQNSKIKVFKLGQKSMETIVRKCYEITPTGGVVLLSPGAASFDMFGDYKERGVVFKQCVNKLPELIKK